MPSAKANLEAILLISAGITSIGLGANEMANYRRYFEGEHLESQPSLTRAAGYFAAGAGGIGAGLAKIFYSALNEARGK